MNRDTPTSTESEIKPGPEEPKKFKPQVVPNRKQLRRNGLNLTRRTGKGHVRIASKKKTPASFHTLVNIPIRNSAGEVTRRIVVPRAMMES